MSVKISTLKACMVMIFDLVLVLGKLDEIAYLGFLSLRRAFDCTVDVDKNTGITEML